MPFALRRVDHGDHGVRVAPDVGAQRLDVRDVHRDARFAPDAQHLAHGREQPDRVRALVALVRVVDAAECAAATFASSMTSSVVE